MLIPSFLFVNLFAGGYRIERYRLVKKFIQRNNFMDTAKKILFALLAGAFGGIVNSLAVWLFGLLGITPMLGFEMKPVLTLSWLLIRTPPSAIWGLLFLLPFWQSKPIRKGLLYGIPLWLSMMFLVFPMKMNAGYFGLKLGIGAPFWVYFFAALWGVSGTLLYGFLVPTRSNN